MRHMAGKDFYFPFFVTFLIGIHVSQNVFWQPMASFVGVGHNYILIS